MAQTQTQTAKAPVIEHTMSERFTAMVVNEFRAAFGAELQLSPMQKRLAQHLFIKIDQALASFELKRLDEGKKDVLPYTWQNINLPKLASDSIHRINLGLDALIPNHISPIAYYNKRERKYDLDLRVGYVGKDYYRRKVAITEPVDVIYELVYSKDTFKPIKKNAANAIESFEFEIVNPWDRGEIVGGFGYIMYEDPTRNKLVIVTEKDFKKSEDAAKSGTFWKNYRTEMKFKTLVHRVTDKLTIDPAKVNESYAAVERDDAEGIILAEIEANSNKEPLDIEPGQGETDQGQPEETEQAPPETPAGDQPPRQPKQQPIPQNAKGPGF